MKVISQSDRALERELGARADREVGAGRGVAHQGEVLVRPALAQHAREIYPGRAAQMSRVRHQRLAAEILGEDPLARGDRLLAAHVAEPPGGPGRLAAFDDEGRGLRLELV